MSHIELSGSCYHCAGCRYKLVQEVGEVEDGRMGQGGGGIGQGC